MVAFGHTAVGASVGLLAYQTFGTIDPIIGLPLAGACGVVSHYLADLIPHGHFFRLKPKDYKKEIMITILFDLLLGVLLYTGIIYFKEGLSVKFWYVLFGIGGAQLPDVIANLDSLHLLPKSELLKKEASFHLNTHWHGKYEKALSIRFWDLWQVTVAILSVIFLVYS